MRYTAIVYYMLYMFMFNIQIETNKTAACWLSCSSISWPFLLNSIKICNFLSNFEDYTKSFISNGYPFPLIPPLSLSHTQSCNLSKNSENRSALFELTKQISLWVRENCRKIASKMEPKISLYSPNCKLIEMRKGEREGKEIEPAPPRAEVKVQSVSCKM